MEREIIFRGKRTDKGEWVEGSLVQMLVDGRIASCIAPIEEVGRANKDVPPMGILYTLNKDIFIVHPDTIGQYTGMIDKNGNKIFEGDIVEYQYVICEEDGVGVYENPVTFESGCFCIDGDSEFTLSYAIWSSDEYGGLKVVGNIHDNPDLLKGGER